MKIDDFETYSKPLLGGKYRIAVSIPRVGLVPDEDADQLAREIAKGLREIADGFDETPTPKAKA